jgi:hypothetical protein
MPNAKELRRELGGYFANADVKGNPQTLTITKCGIEEVGEKNEEKVVLRFAESRKGLVMSATRVNQLEQLFGDDDVIGKAVKLVLDIEKVNNRDIAMICVRPVD